MNLDSRLLRQARSAGVFLMLTIGLSFLGGVFTIIWARQLSKIINSLFISKIGLISLMPEFYVLLGIIIFRVVLSTGSEALAGIAAVKIKTSLRKILVTHLFRLGPSFSQRENSAELMTQAVQGIEALDAYFSQYIPQLALAVMLPLSILLVVFPMDLLTGVVLLITAPLVIIFMILIGKNSERLTRRQWGALGKMSAFFLDTLQGLATLKAFGRSREQAKKIEEVSERYRITTINVLKITFLSALVLEFVTTISTAVVAVEIGLRLLYGKIFFEQAFFILVITPEFYFPLRVLGMRFHAGMTGVSAAKRIYQILEVEPAEGVRVTPATSSKKGDVYLDVNRPYTIQFKNVCYRYPNRLTAAVENIDLTIHSGQRVALAGPSGAGKTTLFHLLIGLIFPDSGDLYFNSNPIYQVGLGNWREMLSWVPQTPYVFYGTIYENLLLWKPDATREQVIRAVQQANLEDVIDSLPQGYETIIGEMGSGLSGGQIQRLALARAFLRNAPILLLDEPTSHLDYEQEKLFDSAVQQLYKGRTVFLIGHRVSTIKTADQIIYLEKGKIKGIGTYSQFLNNKNSFPGLFKVSESY